MKRKEEYNPAFKILDKLIKEIKESKAVTDHNNNGYVNYLDNQLSLLQEIKDYQQSFEWLKKKGYKDKVQTYIDSGFSYKTLMSIYEGTEESLRSSMSYANAAFLSKIGTNTLKLIQEGNLEEARIQFYLCSGKLQFKDIFPQFIIDKLPDAKYSTLSLKDCTSEIRYLYNYSLAAIQARYAKLDKDALAFIQWVLTSDSEKATSCKHQLMLLLLGGVKPKEVEDYLSSL